MSVVKNAEIEKMSVKELEREVQKHNQLYFIEHRPEISDQKFDLLVEALKRKKPNSDILERIGSDLSATGRKVKHRSPMLSLDKCYEEKGLLDWSQKFEGDIIATPKIDGCAVSLRYDRDGRLSLAVTRGNGIIGDEITANARHIHEIPQKSSLHDVEVRGEIYMPLSVFASYRGEFSNPRNLTAGAIKQKDPKKTGDYRLSFFAFDLLNAGAATEMEKRSILEKEGFVVVSGRKVKRDELQRVYEAFSQQRYEWDFETDGVVFRVDRVDEQERLGNTLHHPRYAIAYKFQGESGTTTLLDIEWSVSRTGVITPVGIVKPVELSGAMVSRASLHNVGLMKKLKLSQGARVLMMRRGGVIPNLEAVVKPGKEPFPIPKRCPSCGSSTELRDGFLYCTNPKKCVRSKVGELAHFVKVTEIDGFGEKLITQLYEQGLVTDPSEFYELTQDELLRLERMGETLATKLIRNVEQRQRLPLDVFLRSLGIRELGKHTSKVLADSGNLKQVLALNEQELSEIHTIGPVIAREVTAGLRSKRKLIDRLLRHVDIERERSVQQRGPLSGKLLLFTGTLAAMGRKEAQKRVEEAGGENAQSVTNKLDYLVVGDKGAPGSKLVKAEEMNRHGGKVRVLSEEEFLELIGESIPL